MYAPAWILQLRGVAQAAPRTVGVRELDVSEPVREVVAVGAALGPALGGGDRRPGAVAARQLEGASDSARRDHYPFVPGKRQLHDRDAHALAGRDSRHELDVAGLLPGQGHLVVEAASRRVERSKSDLEPLVAPVRAEPGAADSYPGGDVAAADRRRVEHGQRGADSRR